MIQQLILIAATTWLLQGPNDQVCTGTYTGSETTPVVGTHIAYPAGSKIAPLPNNGDTVPSHYSIAANGALLWNGVQIVDAVQAIKNIRNDSNLTAAKKKALFPYRQIIWQYALDPAGAKTDWAALTAADTTTFDAATTTAVEADCAAAGVILR